MKTVLSLFAAVLLVSSTQAQRPSAPKAKTTPPAAAVPARDKATQQPEPKQVEFDPQTKAQLESNRALLYNLGVKKSGC